MKKTNFHIVKRDAVPWHFSVLIRAAAIIASLLVSAVVITVLTKKNPIEVYTSMIKGAFGSELRIWSLVQNIAVLLCISLAVTPAFKMKFWNCGAEGQVLIGGLATISVMMFLGDSLPYPVLLIVMILASVLAGIIWAVVPAFFKAMWNTNETLFTLMMNYVAIQLVAFFLKYFVKSGSGILSPMPEYGLPVIGDYAYLLNIIIVAVLTVLVYIYLKKTKHGYEIAVVGESENTAKYIGINVKKVIIRTLVVSGALCGIAGLILVGGTNHTISTTTAGGRGFTAIMVSWLAKFNPIYMVLTSFLIVFLEKGAGQVSTDFRLPLAISDIVTGIILFFIIGCEFFLNYKILVSKNGKEND
ncbi:MAG: ABC transporter permease [Clostridia bacterium]|nr:ABC transporter permease [Clostridia bacterium]MBR2078915.1 ABC transporter permease [Clostridia bacterium]MBR2417216.1 ABC transporter permease [Clostridia bacterium]